jgi:endonuclease G
MKPLVSLFVFCLICLSQSGFADVSLCGKFQSATGFPTTQDAKLLARATLSCHPGYAVNYSSLADMPLWVIEHLTKEGMTISSTVQDKDINHTVVTAENDQASLIMRDGYVMMSLASPENSRNQQLISQAFDSQLYIPIATGNAEIIWNGINKALHDNALAGKDFWVISGTLFMRKPLKVIDGHYYVPTHLFKLIYDPNSGHAGVYLVENTPDGRYRTMNVLTLNSLGGFNYLPKLNATSHSLDEAMYLPTPEITFGESNLHAALPTVVSQGVPNKSYQEMGHDFAVWVQNGLEPSH